MNSLLKSFSPDYVRWPRTDIPYILEALNREFKVGYILEAVNPEINVAVTWFKHFSGFFVINISCSENGIHLAKEISVV